MIIYLKCVIFKQRMIKSWLLIDIHAIVGNPILILYTKK